MTERQPSVREIREAARDIQRKAEEQPPDFSALDAEQVLQQLAVRYPHLKTERALEAFKVHMDASERAVARQDLEMQQATSILNFLKANSYANLDEAADDLGFFDLQEVWDYVMAQAKLPPSTAPETIEIE